MLPRFIRLLSRWRIVLVLVVITLAGSAWYVFSHGGWINTLHLPPVVDASTPRAQNGFTLLDVQLPGQYQDKFGRELSGFQYEDITYQTGFTSASVDITNAFGLWISSASIGANRTMASSLPTINQAGDIDSLNNAYGKAYSFTAKLSSGETVPLEWHLRAVEWPQEDDAKRRLLFVTLPNGYSDTCHFVDITASDLSGHTARWRITRLPQMRHAVPPSSKIIDTVTKNGITMSAQAWRGSGWQEQPGQIECILRPNLPLNSHQWDMKTTDEQEEWEPFGYDGHNSASDDDDIDPRPIEARNGIFNTNSDRWYGGGITGWSCTDYYPHMNHFMRLTVALHQFETYDEPVTFHNVDIARYVDSWDPKHPNFYIATAQPQFTTTPSRVAVTLLPRRTGSHLFDDTESGKISLKLLLVPEAKLNFLPNSPLCKTYGKPVRLQIIMAQPFDASGWSGGPGPEHNISLWPPNLPAQSVKEWPKVTPQHLSTFTVIVRQRVELQTIPMTFTLPIADQAPPYYPKGYQPPK